MPGIFQFKQFSVDQSGCAMKINTDGVLLGAVAGTDNITSILDIGAGTGVIALMLAQKFDTAKVDAVEIDADAAQTAERNFKESTFARRLNIYPLSFEEYFYQFPEIKYDLIVSNPPFYVNSLKSPGEKKTLAKHADIDFFEKLIKFVVKHLTADGCCWLILPVDTAELIMEFTDSYGIYLQKIIDVYSYPHSQAHRKIICFGFNKVNPETSNLTIYKTEGIYSDEHKMLLQPYFINF